MSGIRRFSFPLRSAETTSWRSAFLDAVVLHLDCVMHLIKMHNAIEVSL